MSVSLDFSISEARFIELAKEGNLVPVGVELYGDGLTPVSVFHAFASEPYAFFLESAEGADSIGRYSFIGFDPVVRFRVTGHTVEIMEAGKTTTSEVDNPVRALGELMSRYQPVKVPGLPPFTGGAVGYAGYDTMRYFEHLPNMPKDDLGFDDMWFGIFDQVIYFDHFYNRIGIVVMALVQDSSPAEAYHCATERIKETVTRLGDLTPLPLKAACEAGEASFESTFDQAAFESAVEQSKEYIKAGDIIQVVLSQRLAVKQTVDPLSLYRALRIVNPSPYMFALKMKQDWLVGSSPEVMVKVQDRDVTVRPIAGTRPRGQTPEEDLAFEKDLLADPKEIAEHVMLLDLGRNDVGRISEPGSVTVGDRMIIERFSHVMHITSSVHGILKSDVSVLDALEACLPAGTVSGAPKIRAMEIIDEFEPCKRGPYAGAVGYLDFSGNLDTCIAIRTVMIRNGRPYIQAGAGIVADSVPAKEYAETLNKARGLLKAIAMADPAA